MRYLSFLLFSVLFLNVACNKYESQLTYAMPYEIVGGHEITMNSEGRDAKMWFIVSEANTYEEFAQTAIMAALDQKKNNKKCDLINVILVPNSNLTRSGISYASVKYAVDKKGLKDVSGADQNTMVDFKWFVRAAEYPLDKQELEIANLWFNHISDFPSEVFYSSLGYNEEKLKNFIADSLSLTVEEVNLPHLKTVKYEGLDFLD